MHYPKVLERVDSPEHADISSKYLVGCPCNLRRYFPFGSRQHVGLLWQQSSVLRILISSVVIDTECIKITTAFWKQVSPFHSFSHINYGLVEPNTLYHVYAVIVCLHAWMARLYCQNSICQIECQHSKMSAKAPIQSSNLFNRECHFLVAIRHFSNWLDTFQIDQFPFKSSKLNRLH